MIAPGEARRAWGTEASHNRIACEADDSGELTPEILFIEINSMCSKQCFELLFE